MTSIFKRVAAVFAISIACVGSLQAQELMFIDSPEVDQFARPEKTGITKLDTKWFVLNRQQQTSTSTPSDDYVFPDKEKRFKRYVRGTIGPFTILRNAAAAGLDQWNDLPEEWGQGAEGYGKRFASNMGKNAIRQTVQYGLSEAFRLDTGFAKSKKKGFWPRLSDALVQNVTSRTKSGKRVLSAPILVGVYSSSIIAYETWYPDRHNYKDGLRSGTYTLLTGFGINVVREFVFNF